MSSQVPPQLFEPPVVLAFGTETDNSRHLAEQLAHRCHESGISCEVIDLGMLKPRRLNKVDHLVVITATHGDGDPPEPITPFYDALMSDQTAAFKSLKFAVLALGDSTYDHFCATGIALDQRLADLGGERLLQRLDCDVDFATVVEPWFNALLNTLPRTSGSTPAFTGAAVHDSNAPTISKQSPLTVEVITNQNLSHPDRAAPIHHLELALESDELSLQPGDAVGVMVDNPPDLVAMLLQATQLSGEQPVKVNATDVPLVEALRKHKDLTIPGKNLLNLWAELTRDPKLQAIQRGDSQSQRQYLRTHQVRDLVAGHPACPEAQQWVDALRPLQPRLYDAANSLRSIADELHLTVKDFGYAFGNRLERGIASQYLLNLQPGDEVDIYPHRNARFHLPADSSTPLILIADSTGIAPYRAFLQALMAQADAPPCWLVFAEQHFEEDFLYQLDVQSAFEAGCITHIDTIFYRDLCTPPNRSLATPFVEQPERFANWMARGAHVYFCGDKEKLECCERQLIAVLDKREAGTAWPTALKNKQIHRNLY